MADPRELPDSGFWRGWNSQAANQWNAYDQGLDAPTPNFGDYSNQYAENQAISRLPFRDQQTAMMNRYRVAQDAMQNRRAQETQNFDQGMAMERLGLDMERARSAAEVRQAQRDAANDPFKQASGQLQGLERGLGANPFELIGLADQTPDWQQSGMVKMPGRWTFDPMTGQETQLPGRSVPLDQNTYDFIRRLRNQMIPGYGQPQASAEQGMPQLAYPENLEPNTGAAMPVMNENRAARIQELRRKAAVSAQPDMTPQDFGYPN